jgi:hypothetical protein
MELITRAKYRWVVICSNTLQALGLDRWLNNIIMLLVIRQGFIHFFFSFENQNTNLCCSMRILFACRPDVKYVSDIMLLDGIPSEETPSFTQELGM